MLRRSPTTFGVLLSFSFFSGLLTLLLLAQRTIPGETPGSPQPIPNETVGSPLQGASEEGATETAPDSSLVAVPVVPGFPFVVAVEQAGPTDQGEEPGPGPGGGGKPGEKPGGGKQPSPPDGGEQPSPPGGGTQPTPAPPGGGDQPGGQQPSPPPGVLPGPTDDGDDDGDDDDPDSEDSDDDTDDTPNNASGGGHERDGESEENGDD